MTLSRKLQIAKSACNPFQPSLRFTCTKAHVAVVTTFCKRELMVYVAYACIFFSYDTLMMAERL